MPNLRDLFNERLEKGLFSKSLPLSVERTIEAYCETLNHWDRCTKNPDITKINLSILDEFVLAAKLTLGPETVNKHLRHIHHLLEVACGLDYIAKVPPFSYCRTYKRDPRVASEVEINAIYLACECAKWPIIEGVKPGDWWRCLIVAAVLVGIRRGGLIPIKGRPAISWENIEWMNHKVRVPAECDKCGVERIKPLHPILAAHLVKIKTDRQSAAFVRCTKQEPV